MGLRKALAAALLLCVLKLSYGETAAGQEYFSGASLDEPVSGESEDDLEGKLALLLSGSHPKPILEKQKCGEVQGESQDRLIDQVVRYVPLMRNLQAPILAECQDIMVMNPDCTPRHCSCTENND